MTFRRFDLKELATEQAESVAAVSVPVDAVKQTLMGYPGVVGVGEDGPNLVVFVKSGTVAPALPPSVNGRRVLLRVSGSIGTDW